jgi:hypothetical protein
LGTKNFYAFWQLHSAEAENSKPYNESFKTWKDCEKRDGLETRLRERGSRFRTSRCLSGIAKFN